MGNGGLAAGFTLKQNQQVLAANKNTFFFGVDY
jgi:hypothetical protein